MVPLGNLLIARVIRAVEATGSGGHRSASSRDLLNALADIFIVAFATGTLLFITVCLKTVCAESTTVSSKFGLR